MNDPAQQDAPPPAGTQFECVECGAPLGDEGHLCRLCLREQNPPPFDYPAAARSIALNLKEFCDESLLFPEMIADAARKASKEIERLREPPAPPAGADAKLERQIASAGMALMAMATAQEWPRFNVLEVAGLLRRHFEPFAVKVEELAAQLAAAERREGELRKAAETVLNWLEVDGSSEGWGGSIQLLRAALSTHLAEAKAGE